MKLAVRLVVVLLAAVWLAAPSLGGEGGENAGGTGVWVLPGGSSLGGNGQSGNLSREIPNLTKDFKLTVASNVGAFVATACEAGSGVIVPLASSGRDVLLPAAMLRGFRDENVAHVDIVIADSEMVGYRIRLSIPAAGETATLTIY
ncbi:MAG: hypothetical protein KDE27_05175 [Planctomycetes bacterium]|nr:hypothetical protein [Planctomycetota bacterium]